VLRLIQIWLALSLLGALNIGARADANTDFARGVARYKAGEYAAAIAMYRQAAAFAHHGAQFNLGLMYANGIGVTQDNVTAHMWYEISIGNTGTKAVKTNVNLQRN